MSKVFVILVTVIVVGVLLISGCAQPAPAPKPSPAPVPAPAPAPLPATPIKIGMIFPQTGPVAPIGQFMVLACNYAFEEIGYEVAGRKIQTFVEDDAGRPDMAVDKARKLIENDKVDMILGPLVVACVESTAPYIAKMGIPQLLASPLDLSRMGQYEWQFLVTGSNRQMVYPMAFYAYDKLGFKTITAIGADNASGRLFLGSFIDAFKSKGGNVIQEQWPPFGNPDFAPYFANLKDADACAAWFEGADAARFHIQYNEFGIRKRMPLQAAYFGAFVQPFLLNNLPPPAANAMVGEHMLTLYSYLLDFPESKKFDEAWFKKFNYHPDDVHATPYLLVQVALRALKATNGDTTPAKLRQAILAVDFESCEGRFRFDAATRCGIRDTFIAKIGKVDNKFATIPVESYKGVLPSGLK